MLYDFSKNTHVHHPVVMTHRVPFLFLYLLSQNPDSKSSTESIGF